MEQLGAVIKAARAGALATLIRLLGDFDLAEEAVQEATCRALVDWRRNGVPANPLAWLVQTGRRYAIDVLRHKAMAQQHQEALVPLAAAGPAHDDDDALNALHLPDDQLRLMFICCHPALAQESQVALTLKTVAGLSVDEIARAYLSAPKTIEQRLTRAKRKIRSAVIAYQVPAPEQLAGRLDAVMRVLYLIYNQAYTTLTGAALLDSQLAAAAIYLARVLNRLVRQQAEAQGLLALMLLQHARAAARVDGDGMPVPLEQQDRALWDAKQIAEGTAMVEKSLRQGPPGPYGLQAAIAAVHCRAASAAETDWGQIVALYELLEIVSPNPVVTLNRAVAVARVQGAAAGLRILDVLSDHKNLLGFQYYHSARAGLLEEAGDYSRAVAAYRQALSLCRNEAEGTYMNARIERLRRCMDASSPGGPE